MRRLPIGLLVSLLLLPAFGVAPTHVDAAVAVWPTYHLDAGRSGNDTTEPSFRNLKSAWTVGPLDGQIFAEPLVYGNSLIVATMNNTVYSFDVGIGSWAWNPVNLGTPRTSFPSGCGSISPIGILGTPTIDGGFLYVLADIQTSSTSFEFHLAKIDPTNGAVIYNKNITPSGMDTSIQQSRGALSVSNGNVVIGWGGHNGDCGNYHGFVETVSEASGVEQHQWATPSSGSRGAIWGSSGPAVDSAGNIFVATGNGSSNINNYDFSDSVLKFSPALDPPSFFAPQGWPSLGASDADLGSVGPELLPNGRLFQIGKSGRGYLLNQAALPNNSNPGGGENASLQICNKTSDAAFSGMANNGGTVFVPCSDGIAAVSIDSSSSFHRVWYQTSGGGSAPILAGGLVWSLKMFGGSTLYGLDPSSGSIVTTLTLPANNNHFATPSAGDKRLFVPDGTFVAAFVPPSLFSPQGVGAPQVAVTPDGTQQLVFWQGAGGHLLEAWFNGHWNGPVDWSAANGWGSPLNSAPSVTVTPNGAQQLVFWQGSSGHLIEAWFDGHWNGPVDWTATNGWGAPLTSAPSVILTPGGTQQLVFWQGAGGHLLEAWFDGHWNGPVDWTTANGWGVPLASAPSVAVAAGGTQMVFWQGAGGHLIEAWFDGHWNGPADWTAANGWGSLLNSAPSVAVAPGGTQLVFWQGAGGHLIEAWFDGHWNGPADWTAANGWGSPLTSAPSVTLTPGGAQQLVFWQGAGGHLIEAWFDGHWNGPVDWSS